MAKLLPIAPRGGVLDGVGLKKLLFVGEGAVYGLPQHRRDQSRFLSAMTAVEVTISWPLTPVHDGTVGILSHNGGR